MKRYSISLIIKEMKTMKRYDLTSVRMAVIKMRDNKRVGEVVEKREPYVPLVVM